MSEQPDSIPVKDTPGYHLLMAKVLFGDDSPAVTWLEDKIKDSPHGADEPVIAPEEQVVQLLCSLHFVGTVHGSAKL
jgi:hypothetical protein